MARTTSTKFAPKTGAGTLRPVTDPDLAPPVSRLGAKPLLPTPFRPAEGNPKEADGAPLSKFGEQFRAAFAKAHGVSTEEVDLGIVRQVEALNADTNYNSHALTLPRIKRTEFGTLTQVSMVVNTPLLLPWLINGRALRRMGPALRGNTHLLTSAGDHERFSLPVMEVGGASDVLDIVSAQRRVLDFASYSSTGKNSDLIDSIIQYGVLTPPDVVLTQLRSPEGTSWVPQVAEGARRLSSAHLVLDVLANRGVSGVATDRWVDGLSDIGPEYLVGLADALKFTSTAAHGFFPGNDVDAWRDSFAKANPAAVVFQLLRTMEVNLVLSITPDEDVEKRFHHPVAATIQEMIRGYHMPGKAKKEWDLADVFGLIAVGSIDDLLEDGRITAADRLAWLGQTVPEWSGGPDAYGGATENRLVSVTKLLAALTAQGACPVAAPLSNKDDSLAIVDRNLRENANGNRPSPKRRAEVAAAQATVMLEELRVAGVEGTVQAAFSRIFHDGWFWNTEKHATSEPWTALLTLPLAELAARAQQERQDRERRQDADGAGPAQRAIAALGGVALVVNPVLIADEESLTATARGGGGFRFSGERIPASDPSELLKVMVRAERGINQLEDAIAQLVATAQPGAPADREDNERLTEYKLRKMWLSEAGSKTDSPELEFDRQVQELIEAIKKAGASAERLRTLTRSDLTGDTRSQDESDFGLEEESQDQSLYLLKGVDPEKADAVLGILSGQVDFFQVGKAINVARSAVR